MVFYNIFTDLKLFNVGHFKLVQDLYGSEETKSFVWHVEAHFHASVRTDSDVGLAALPYIQGISQTGFPVLQSAQKHLF